MKDYFINVDFYNKHVNKFVFGIVAADLSEEKLAEIAERFVDEQVEKAGLPRDGYTINVKAFNEISL